MFTRNLDNVLARLDEYRATPTAKQMADAQNKINSSSVMRVKDRTISYSERHRGQWFRPEYDFDEIQIAQDTDSYLFRAIQKKVGRVICAGMSFTGSNAETVEYIENRLKAMGWAAQKPWRQVVWDTFHDLFRYSNCMWVKKRSNELSAGSPRKDINGTQIDPVAGYFILPFETLEFRTKANGEFKKILQKMPDGSRKEFYPRDVVHFYTNKKPGFVVGTPEMFPALDDIALLRRIEENIEDLIEANLFPVFHYKIGSDQFPERYGPDGTKESDIVKTTIEYMPAGGIYVSDHRHDIKAVGSEGRALRIDFYVGHFKNRVLAAIGASAVDMGEGGSANRSTASTMSKAMLMDIEAMTCIVKEFVEFYVISELLIEGGYNPLDRDQMVKVKFGIIDKEERRADENQQIQLFHGNLRTMQEVRASLGDPPYTDAHLEESFFKMFAEPLALGQSGGPAALATLAEHPSSSITPEAAKKEEVATASSAKASATESASAASANKSRPANQHGKRSSTKTNRDINVVDESGVSHTITCDFEVDSDSISLWNQEVLTRWAQMGNNTISFKAMALSMAWRLKRT